MGKREVYENLTVEQIKSAESSTLNNYMHEIMQMIMDNPTIISLLYSSNLSKYNKDAYKSIENMKSMVSELFIELGKYKQLASNPDKWLEKLGPRFKDNIERYGVVLKFVSSATSVFSIAARIEKMLRQKLEKDEFAINVNSMNRKIESVLTKAISEMAVEENTGFNIDDCFEMLHCFGVDIDALDFTKVIEEIKAEEKANVEAKAVKAYQSAPNEKEQERLAKIAEVNELFERFKIDFLRDLEKEVSLMNRDMYEALIDKFEKFVKSFSMPLSTNVSLGMANEALGQMNKMFETFYEISKNTYSPVVFGG